MNKCDPTTSPQLLLIAVENCSWPDLHTYITTLIHLGHLSWVVIDKAHLLEMHEPFRPCMATLEFLGQLAVSIVLMTATCLCALKCLLFGKLGWKVYQVLWQSTN
jgi:hypothetical protein